MRDFQDMVRQAQEARAPQDVADKVEQALSGLPGRAAAGPQVTVLPGGKRPRAGRGKLMPAAVAACAALAVCLVAAPVVQNGGGAQGAAGEAPAAASVADHLGRAFAVKQAFAEEARPAGDPRIAFADQGIGQSSEDGTFTGLLFQVEGTDIATVSASIDKGELYRLTRSEVSEAEFKRLLDDGSWGEDDSPRSVHMLHDEDDDHSTMTDDYCEPLGRAFEDAYGSGTSYGFFLPASQLDGNAPQYADDAGKEFFHDAIDAFDGATLEITVTYGDGTQATQSYTLASGKLKVREGAHGEPQETLQEFEDDPGRNPYVYGLLATLR